LLIDFIKKHAYLSSLALFDSLSVQLSICLLVPRESLAQSLLSQLSQCGYLAKLTITSQEFLEYLAENGEEIDCLVILRQPSTIPIFNQMFEQGILLPTVLIISDEQEKPHLDPTYVYHSAEVKLLSSNLEELPIKIPEAINQFLHLGQSCSLLEDNQSNIDVIKQQQEEQKFKTLQQRRLTDKLKERLGYLGVYYRRNSKLFYRNLDPEERAFFLQDISENYRKIILDYFAENIDINSEIDQYVNKLFFYDFSVSQVLEIHMELMDDFAQQLKLEGRSEEILLDYRLVIIDVLAHLCEMYRRSIPREDASYDFQSKI